MKKVPSNQSLIAFAARALDGADRLPVSERVDLLETAALILPTPKLARAAESEAFFLREADRKQLELTELLREARQ